MADQTGAPREDGPTWGSFARSTLRSLVFYWLFRQIASGFFGKTSAPAANVISNTAGAAQDSNGSPLKAFAPVWSLGTPSDVYVFISPKERAADVSFTDPKTLLWSEKALVFGSDSTAKELVIPCTPHLQRNGSLYAHIFLTKAGLPPNPTDPSFDKDTLYHRKLLTRFMPKRKQTSKKKLVSPSSSKETGDALNGTETDPLADTSSTKEKDQPIISYWWPNVTIHATSSDDPLPVQSPPLVLQQLRLTPDGKSFYPFFFVNDFWMLQENLNPINETVQSLNVSLSFSPLAMWKFQLYTQFQESFRIQQDVMGVAQSETDQMKRMFLETNPILLAITFAVSLLHSVFDFLAFKNDIDFWKNRKDMEGLSFRTILLNVIFQSIIFLYLLDNDTSWMILISSGIGLLIEIWKINKSVKTVRKPTFPYVEFKDRVKPSKLTSKTRAYDELAFTYLSWAFFPLLVGYTVYSLLYEEHKSWYSFTVGTLVGFVYTFGFISMTPQLFINYKLKSVAHMPWKTFMYKALNTFIDDLFAFVIKMPLLHRLACLRDDVVFLVYLYQKWIYPEDKRRRNEFGQVGEAGAEGDDDDEEEEDGKLLQEKEDVTKAKETLLVKESKEDVDDAPRERRTRGSPEGSSKESPEESANKKDL